MIKLLKNMQKRERVMVLIAVVLIIGQVFFELTMPDYMSELTLLINTEGQMSDIFTIGAKMLGCTLASAVLAIACGFLTSKIASGYSFAVRDKLFTHVMTLGKAETEKFSIPSLITRTTNDITQLQMIVSMGLQSLVKAPIMAVWAIVKILGKSWELSAVTASAVVVICVTVLSIMGVCMPRFRKVQKLTDIQNRIARENLTGINVVHAFNAEDYQTEKFDIPNNEMMNIQLKNQRLFSLMMPVMSTCMNGLSLAIFWFGAALINQIALSDVVSRITLFSDVVVFSTYATYVVMSFMMLIMVFMLLPAAQVSAERINEVLDKTATIEEGETVSGKEIGTVEFKNVSFTYPEAGEEALSNLSFRVEQGQTLAIIGATGCGKTTLVSLMARFYDASSGEVLIDGVNVKNYSFEGLYNKLGYITQKAVLFAGSIRENITFGQSQNGFDEDDVDMALAISQSEEFVSKMQGGKAHKLLQLGKNVSGGQKQRLSIARALARKPEILIFDDSFSALDYKTDAMLRQGLRKNLKNTTKVIVAQRISTIKDADQIVVLERGEAVGIGTHEELMKRCSVYREIAQSQLTAAELA